MIRVIPLSMLAFALAACQDDGPTSASTDAARFAATKDCNDPKWQGHPTCGGGGEDEAYEATDLGTLPGKRNSSRARDLTEPGSAGDPLLVVGMSETADRGIAATMWTVSSDGVVEHMDVLPLPSDFSDASAYAISDRGTVIAGYADTYASGEIVRLAARWDGGGAWQMTPLQPLEGYRGGIALGVNDQGQAVGWSTAGNNTITVRVATLWGDGTATPLASPLGGVSRARAINNQGYIVGEGWNQPATHGHAILWLPLPGDAPCDLHLDDPQGTETSLARGIADVIDGNVLVAGQQNTHAVVWNVRVTDCAVIESWTMASPSDAIDVRSVNDGWEATVTDPSTALGVPTVWRSSGEQTILAEQGMAIGINGEGRVVGRTKVKGSEHAMLWTPKR
jgi:uncharacterized membrane protein